MLFDQAVEDLRLVADDLDLNLIGMTWADVDQAGAADVVISTLPGERSGWMRSNLIERVRNSTAAPVEHVVVDVQSNATAAPAAG